MNFLQWYGAPLVLIAVSLAYFFGDPRRPAFGARLLASAHGFTGAALYLVALGLHQARPLEYRPYLALPYTLLFLLPLVAIIISFFTFRGSRLFHLLQLLNVAALAWAFFVGSMAITGNWI
jgi:hypothetical protein